MYPINLNNLPDGFELIDDKVPFDPKKHLKLEKPNTVYSLKDLGYSEEIIKDSGTYDRIKLINSTIPKLKEVTKKVLTNISKI